MALILLACLIGVMFVETGAAEISDSADVVVMSCLKDFDWSFLPELIVWLEE